VFRGIPRQDHQGSEFIGRPPASGTSVEITDPGEAQSTVAVIVEVEVVRDAAIEFAELLTVHHELNLQLEPSSFRRVTETFVVGYGTQRPQPDRSRRRDWPDLS
jgi:hypothetical protein